MRLYKNRGVSRGSIPAVSRVKPSPLEGICRFVKVFLSKPSQYFSGNSFFAALDYVTSPKTRFINTRPDPDVNRPSYAQFTGNSVPSQYDHLRPTPA